LFKYDKNRGWAIELVQIVNNLRQSRDFAESQGLRKKSATLRSKSMCK
jgi:hypothetical protein